MSFTTANFMGRVLNYRLGPDWLIANWGKAEQELCLSLEDTSRGTDDDFQGISKDRLP